MSKAVAGLYEDISHQAISLASSPGCKVLMVTLSGFDAQYLGDVGT